MVFEKLKVVILTVNTKRLIQIVLCFPKLGFVFANYCTLKMYFMLSLNFVQITDDLDSKIILAESK